MFSKTSASDGMAWSGRWATSSLVKFQPAGQAAGALVEHGCHPMPYEQLGGS